MWGGEDASTPPAAHTITFYAGEIRNKSYKDDFALVS